jgi:RimJ/RimL family protein N-acetyltransferase
VDTETPAQLADHWTELHAGDGLVVRVRPERPGDGPLLVELFDRLSADSRYLRFSKSLTRPDPAQIKQEAERLARLEPPAEMAWLAFADVAHQPDVLIGAVRYAPVGPGAAELAITVRDDMQRQGIGTALLRFVCEQARAQGLNRLVAVFRSDNRAVWALVRLSPYPTQVRLDGGEVTIELDLTKQLPRVD